MGWKTPIYLMELTSICASTRVNPYFWFMGMKRDFLLRLKYSLWDYWWKPKFPFWIKIMPKRGFLVFRIFLLFFFGIFLPGSSKNGIRDKIFFFSLFLDLSHPVLVRNNVGSVFFNFMIFFAIFFGIFLPRSSMNGIQE